MEINLWGQGSWLSHLPLESETHSRTCLAPFRTSAYHPVTQEVTMQPVMFWMQKHNIQSVPFRNPRSARFSHLQHTATLVPSLWSPPWRNSFLHTHTHTHTPYLLKYLRTQPCSASQVMLVVKNLPASTGDIRDVGSIFELGRSPGGGHGNPL